VHNEHYAFKNKFGLIHADLIQKKLAGFQNLVGFTVGLQT
jgi:hypothetical protein